MRSMMMDEVGLFRTAAGMQLALDKIHELKERIHYIRIDDCGKVFNTNLLNAWEISNLLDLAEVTTFSALARTESRGAHAREDFPKRDDENWLKHSIAKVTPEGIQLTYKPVVITKYQPKERTY